jgi:hypothetical protein
MAVSPRHKKKLTYEEWLDFPAEEGVRTELIDGEVWVAPERTLRHQRIQGRIVLRFANYLEEHGGGEIYPPINVRLASDQGFAPDLVFIRDRGDDPLTYHGPPHSSSRSRRTSAATYVSSATATNATVLRSIGPSYRRPSRSRSSGCTKGPTVRRRC